MHNLLDGVDGEDFLSKKEKADNRLSNSRSLILATLEVLGLL